METELLAILEGHGLGPLRKSQTPMLISSCPDGRGLMASLFWEAQRTNSYSIEPIALFEPDMGSQISLTTLSTLLTNQTSPSFKGMRSLKSGLLTTMQKRSRLVGVRVSSYLSSESLTPWRSFSNSTKKRSMQGMKALSSNDLMLNISMGRLLRSHMIKSSLSHMKSLRLKWNVLKSKRPTTIPRF